ncbi:MAG: hypothetical protein K6F33_05500, partial [Bacteroidales bacterium]|nr:hypothetical protein [Bacteroidales bacterium]
MSRKLYISYSGSSDSIYIGANYKAVPKYENKKRDCIVSKLKSELDEGNKPCKIFETSNYSGNISKFRADIAESKYIVIILSN